MKSLLYPFLLLPLASVGQIPTSGLVAHYPFSGNANDASGKGNHGIVQRAEPATDRFGRPTNAYRFSDGARIRVPNSPSLILNRECTFSVWFNLRSYAGRDGNKGTMVANGSHVLFSKDCDRDQRLAAYLVVQQAPAGYLVFGSKEGGSLGYHLTCSLGSWQHLTVTHDGRFICIYLNGQIVAHAAAANPFKQVNQRDLIIGGSACWPFFFNGDLDDFRLYNRALTDAEVQLLYREKP